VRSCVDRDPESSPPRPPPCSALSAPICCAVAVLRASARSYLISPEVLGAVGRTPAAEAVQDRFSAAYLITAIARLLRDVALLRHRADRAGKPLATLALETDITFASAADRAAFAEELSVTLTALAAKYQRDQPGGQSYRFVIGVSFANRR